MLINLIVTKDLDFNFNFDLLYFSNPLKPRTPTNPFLTVKITFSPRGRFAFQTEIYIGQIYCTCVNFTVVLFPFLSSSWGSVYRFLYSITFLDYHDAKGALILLKKNLTKKIDCGNVVDFLILKKFR